MKLSVGLKVANLLSLTPQLQQAIRLLQLSSLELEQEIELQLESNPLLEKVEEQVVFDPLSDLPDGQHHEKDLTNQLNVNYLPDDLPVDTDWDDVYSNQPTGLASIELEEREDNRQIATSLKEHMLEQINLLHFSMVDKLIAHCIIDALNDKGFLDCSLEDITASVQYLLKSMHYDDEVEEDEILAVLKSIQRLDPVGIASRNLVECLTIQLMLMPEHTASKKDALLLLQYYQLLVSNELTKLLKYTHLSIDQLKQAIDLLKTLKPYPGELFEQKQIDYQIPDIVVSKKMDHWLVELNPDVVIKLRVSPFYMNMIRRADQTSDNQYLRHQMLEAKNFIKSVDERHKTLLKVATCIVKKQKAFFEQGTEAMQPLVLRDIAAEVDLHESTISRVTTNKYMLTPRGLFELKYFFSSHVTTTSGGEASSVAIRAKIKKLIAQENSHKPLSDNAISNILKQEGISVARRTVAKYRESLHIPSSSERKVLI